VAGVTPSKPSCPRHSTRRHKSARFCAPRHHASILPQLPELARRVARRLPRWGCVINDCFPITIAIVLRALEGRIRSGTSLADAPLRDVKRMRPVWLNWIWENKRSVPARDDDRLVI
jgi:hypothetical protein